MITVSRNMRMPALIRTIERFEEPEDPANTLIKAVYTRQDEGEWTLFMVSCTVGATDDETDSEDIYRNLAFATRFVPNFLISSFLEELGAEGFQVSEALPPLKDYKGNANWTEEIVPSHATGSPYPARRFSARIEDRSHFHDGQLFGHGKPYHKSARRYVSEFLSLGQFHGHGDARNGEVSIQIPDQRGAITLTPDHLSFTANSEGLAVVGQVNDDTPVTLSARTQTRRLDTDELGDVQLWLVTTDDEIVDYRSSTEWPYQFENEQDSADLEADLKRIIDSGESETCEFKKFIGLNDKNNNKAPDFEKTVCAFSNLRGGVLLIGVDDEGEVVGLEREVEKAYKTNPEKAAALYEKAVDKRLKESLRDTHCFSTQVTKLYASIILVITVSQSPETNYLHYSNEAYIRRGATSRRMPPPEIQAQGKGQAYESY